MCLQSNIFSISSVMREQLDQENSQCKESGEKENERSEINCNRELHSSQN